jgi:hypothetical protein
MMINHELHRRNAFWVDESLAYMLDQTELDVVGGELRVPFASFALVFTDRHMLSLAERLLAKERDNPLAGHLLRVATVDVTEYQRGGGRVLEVCFVFDALDADARVARTQREAGVQLRRRVLPARDDQHLQGAQAPGARTRAEGPCPDAALHGPWATGAAPRRPGPISACRWIEPVEGPDMAAIIERAYRLKD